MRTSTQILTLVTLLAAAGIAPAQAGQNINQRQATQDARIEQGVRSGELTRWEARYLEQRQQEVAQLERKLRRHGLDRAERVRLNGELDRLSAEIYRLKHNRAERLGFEERRVSWWEREPARGERCDRDDRQGRDDWRRWR